MAVKEIICDTYHCTFEEESLETIRLTVHLKFLAARILRHTPWQDAGLESMYTVLLQRDSRNEVCLQRINAICVRNLITSWIIRSRSICSST